MDFSEWMEGFGSGFGLDGFAPNKDGVYRVDIDGMEISFAELADPSRVLMWAKVCEPPEKGQELLYRVMLEAMFMGQATGGGGFSVDTESGGVFLQRTDPLATFSLEAFNATLERFVNILEQWRSVVADFEPVAGVIEAARREADEETRRMGSGGFMQV